MKSRTSILRRFAKCMIAATVPAALFWYVLPWFVPIPAALLENQNASPVILDRNGHTVSRLTLPDSTRSTPLPTDRLPADLIQCTLAAEDKRFYQHGGIDLLATLRASRDLCFKRRVISGASTITQQLIKISSPPASRSPLTKVREALAARHLEMTWDKGRILTAYLNRLDYGNLRTGTAEAARFYFQKPLNDLSLAEFALLAGIPQAPSRLNPIRHPERALTRRNIVLQRLYANGKTPPGRIASAMTEAIQLRPLREESPAPWMAVITPPQPADPAEPRATIRTTLDLNLQRDIESIVTEETTKLKDANLRHAAVVVIHNPTGEILALVTSANWNDPRGGQINGTTTPRSPGSTLKPFTYLLAMEQLHYTPATILEDIPSPFRTPEGLALPENYDRKYRGPVPLRGALACSLNVPAMRVLNSLGGPRPLYGLLTTLGMTTLGKDPDANGLGLTIGNAPASLLELTNAYATLARMGRHLPPVLFPSSPRAEPRKIPVSASSCFLIADILSDPEARAPSFPPGGPLDLPFRCAVKTGTSSDFRDNWCIGYTPEFTVGVWAGNFENQPMKGVSGVTGAAPVFHRSMVRLHRDHPPVWPDRPKEIQSITIDARNGKTISSGSHPAHAKNDLSPASNLPPAATDADYDPEGRALIPPAFAAWFAGPHNHRKQELALNETEVSREPLKIISPADGTTFLLDPEVPSGTNRLRPVTNLPGTARWESPTLRVEPGEPEPIVHLVPGTHTLTATDTRNGKSHTLTLHVKAM